MDFDKFLGEMQKLITASQQGDLFGNKQAQAEKANKVCVEYLKGQGYSVGSPRRYPVNIDSIDGLISTFYSYIRNIYPQQMWSHEAPHDRAIAKAFVEARMKADGITRKVALQQCGLIIKVVLNRRDVFKFESAPSFGIFGQGEMAWLTERAVGLINKEIAKENERKNEKAAEEMTERIERQYKTGHSLDELAAISKKLEAKYGKKENR
jgi:hypothetical protein